MYRDRSWNERVAYRAVTRAVDAEQWDECRRMCWLAMEIRREAEFLIRY